MKNKVLFDRFVENLYSLYSSRSVRKCFEFAQGENRVLVTLLMTNNKSLSPSYLTEALEVTKQRTTNILNSLRNKNYISLEMDAEDRRKIKVTLTKKGKEYISQKSDDIESELKNVSDRLGDEKMNKLNELLEEINQILK